MCICGHDPTHHFLNDVFASFYQDHHYRRPRLHQKKSHLRYNCEQIVIIIVGNYLLIISIPLYLFNLVLAFVSTDLITTSVFIKSAASFPPLLTLAFIIIAPSLFIVKFLINVTTLTVALIIVLALLKLLLLPLLLEEGKLDFSDQAFIFDS